MIDPGILQDVREACTEYCKGLRAEILASDEAIQQEEYTRRFLPEWVMRFNAVMQSLAPLLDQADFLTLYRELATIGGRYLMLDDQSSGPGV